MGRLFGFSFVGNSAAGPRSRAAVYTCKCLLWREHICQYLNISLAAYQNSFIFSNIGEFSSRMKDRVSIQLSWVMISRISVYVYFIPSVVRMEQMLYLSSPRKALARMHRKNATPVITQQKGMPKKKKRSQKWLLFTRMGCNHLFHILSQFFSDALHRTMLVVHLRHVACISDIWVCVSTYWVEISCVILMRMILLTTSCCYMLL